MVKLLQSIQHTISYNQHPTEAKNEPQSNWTTRYRVDINLVLLVPHKQKSLKKIIKSNIINSKKQSRNMKSYIKLIVKNH